MHYLQKQEKYKLKNIKIMKRINKKITQGSLNNTSFNSRKRSYNSNFGLTTNLKRNLDPRRTNSALSNSLSQKGRVKPEKTNDLSVKSRLGGVQKNIQTVENGKQQLRLFTRHFDARSKIQTKAVATPGLMTSNVKGASQKALGETRRQNKDRILNQKRNLSTQSQRKSMQHQERESKFTGKSIQIKTENNLMKMRINQAKNNALVKGNSFTVVTKSPSQVNQRKNKIRPRVNENEEEFLSSSTSWKDERFHYNQPPSHSPTIQKPTAAKVVISNLHHTVTQDDIQELFGAIGFTKQATLKNLGTAEVIYSSTEDAFAAYSKYHGRNLDGQPMLLKITAVDEPASVQSQNTNAHTSGFPAARSSNRKMQQYYQPSFGNSRVSSSRVPPSTKPVVFTVKL